MMQHVDVDTVLLGGDVLENVKEMPRIATTQMSMQITLQMQIYTNHIEKQ